MVRIITDGTSDLTAQMAAELGVHVMPMRVFFGQESFVDGVDITREEFFARLTASDELPTTSQLNPDDFLEVFQTYVDQGDEIVGIFLSTELSGTCQSACIARDMVEGGEIHIVDSRTVTFALALLVGEAARMRDEGLSAAQIAAQVEKLAQRTKLMAIVDTLTYLKKGGRISAATAAVGGLLGIKPIVGVDSRGTVEALGKARSIHAGLEWLARRIGGAPADPAYPVAYGHSNSPDRVPVCMEALKDVLPQDRPAVMGSIGAVIGTHVGPGAVGVAYIAAE